MNYLLDTDICIYLMTEREPKKRDRIVAHLESLKAEETVYLSSTTVSELSYGAHKGKWSKANTALLERFLMDFTVAAFDEQAAKACGAIRAALEKKGKPIGPLDTLIAGHTVSVGATLITNNTREFARVPGLHVKNWTAV
ncbi:MAG: type II toxin-antitoxin system tRNA(fMet)-specific endonuclease VapC [Gammaproteobacteria bacterium]